MAALELLWIDRATSLFVAKAEGRAALTKGVDKDLSEWGLMPELYCETLSELG